MLSELIFGGYSTTQEETKEQVFGFSHRTIEALEEFKEMEETIQFD